MSGLDIQYDLGPGHPLLGRRMPDLDLTTPDGPRRVFTLLHDARPVLLDLSGTPAGTPTGSPAGSSAGTLAPVAAPWSDRVTTVTAEYEGPWELPVLGPVPAPTAVLIRPDGHVAWVGQGTPEGLPEALETWFGPPSRTVS